MSSDFTEALVSTETEDGITLHGVLLRSEKSMLKPAIVWIHGFGANFYFPPYLRLGQALKEWHCAFLAGNTRGHDFGTMLAPKDREPHLGGSAWERLEESPYDVASWIDFALGYGFPGVVLIGHSLGVVKVTYYQAQRQDLRVQGLGLASPPLRPTWDTRAHPASLARAQQLVARGHPEELFAGPWGTVSAQTYLSLDRVGFDQFGQRTPAPSLARVRCPVLALLGANEDWVCMPADLDIIGRNAVAAARVETHAIEGADHFYTGRESEAAAVIARWIDTLTS